MTPSRPDDSALNDAWILARRGPRNSVEVGRPYAVHVEPELTSAGCVEDVATVLITNKECPFRCLMCDLWKNTTSQRTPSGAVVEQIRWALGQVGDAKHIKLYNAGSFFDEQAIPRADREPIAELLSGFTTVIVENHPGLIDRRCVEFAERLAPNLEVAMGLETVDPNVLPRLNKRMSLSDFEHATTLLTSHAIRVRAFILLRTPFQSEAEGVLWAQRSVDYAFSIGVDCCVVIPTRAGNGAMEALEADGLFSPPTLRSLEAVIEHGVALARGRVFADLWDIERLAGCPRCTTERVERLKKMNLTQRIPDPVRCDCET